MYWPGVPGHLVDLVGLRLVVLVLGQAVRPDDRPGRRRRLAGDRGGGLDRVDAVLRGDPKGAQDVGVLGLVVGVPVAHLGVRGDPGRPAVGASRRSSLGHGTGATINAQMQLSVILLSEALYFEDRRSRLTQLRSFLAVVNGGSVRGGRRRPGGHPAGHLGGRRDAFARARRGAAGAGRTGRPADAGRPRVRGLRGRRARPPRTGPAGRPRGPGGRRAGAHDRRRHDRRRIVRAAADAGVRRRRTPRSA